MASLAEKLEKLRESERNMITGPPNAAAVDFIKKTEGFLYPENTSFESKLANDPNATVDNTYFPPINPRTPITESGTVLTELPETSTTFMEDLKTHEAAKLGEEWKAALKEGVKNFNELAAESAKNNEVVIDDTQKVGLVTIKDDENLEATASDVAIKSFETHEAVKTDEVLKVTASDEAVRNSLANSAEILKERAIAAHNEFQNDRIDSIAKASDAAKGGNLSIEEEEQLYLSQNNGLNYFETLGKKVEEETGLPPQGAIFTSTDDIPETFTLPDGQVVSSVGVDYIEQLKQIQEKERKEKEDMMEAYRDTVTDGTSESMTSEEKARANNEYLGTSGQASVNAGQDQDSIDAKNKALKEREKALRTTNEIADEKLIEKARLEKLRQEEVARVEAKHNRNEGQDAFSGQGTDAVDPIKNQRGILDRINEERKGGESEATQLRQNQDFANSLDAEQKLMQEKALHERQINSETADNVSANFDKDRSHYRKMQAIKKTAADVNASENAFQEDNGAVNVRSMMRGGANDPYHFTTLAYPPDAVSSQENGHFMLFYVNVQNKTKYSYDGMSNGKIIKVGDYIERPGYFTEGTGGPAGGGSRYITSVEASGTGANAGDVDYQKQMVRNGGKGNIIYNNQSILQKSRKLPKSGINSRYQTTTRITDSVALYLPSGIGNTTSASYGDFQTGVAGYLAMSGLDIVSELRNRDFQGAAEKIFGVGGTLITEAAKKLAVAGIETFTGSEGIQQSVDKAFGQTLNPYIEVAFNSTGMRTFDYTFKFAPKSRAETDEVKAIIQLFRFHMLPEMKSAAHRYLTLPSTFDIHYMWQNGRTTAGENSFYNKIATCVLTNVDINYTPNGQVQSFGDGAPTQIDMSLSFKETEMLTKQHIEEGF